MNPILTPRDAEENAAARMRELGFIDARVTENGPDGGIDVASRGAVAQVKNWNKAVGRPELQRLYGARAGNQHQQMLFFARTGYAKTALEYADTHGIALFIFDHTGAVTRVNGAARALNAPKATSTVPHQQTREWHIDSFIIRRVQSLIGLAGTPIQVRQVGNRGDGEILTGGVVARIRVNQREVDVSDLQYLQSDGKVRLYFFSKSSFSKSAREHANSAGIALFRIGFGRMRALNAHARALKRNPHRTISTTAPSGRVLTRGQATLLTLLGVCMLIAGVMVATGSISMKVFAAILFVGGVAWVAISIRALRN